MYEDEITVAEVILLSVELCACPDKYSIIFLQTYQVSRIRRESHAFECHLTLTRMHLRIPLKSHAL